MIQINVSENIVLRELTETDAEIFSKHANNKKVWDNLHDFFPNPYSVQDALDFIQGCKKQIQKTALGITVDNEAVGMIGFGFLKDVSRKTAQMGYWIGKEYWGKGIVTKCIGAFTEYIFSNFDVIRIQSPVFEFNKPSMRVLEKNGFYLESVMKQSAIKNEKIIDMMLYVKLREK
jgi:RimJ/RimL family protein N-acetyltransferase